MCMDKNQISAELNLWKKKCFEMLIDKHERYHQKE